MSNLINPNITFEDSEDFEKYLKEMCDNDMWEILTIGDMVMDYTKNTSINFLHAKNALLNELKDKGTLYFQSKTSPNTLLAINNSALFTLKDRVGISCRYTTSLLQESAYDLFAKLYNTTTDYYNNMQTKTLIRDGQVLACHSPNYTVIRQDEIFSLLKQKLEAKFPGCIFKGASYNHEGTSATYHLAGSESSIMKNYKEAWERSGLPQLQLDESKATLEVSTGDTGLSCVEIAPLLSIGGAIYPLGEKFKIKHHGKGNLQTVESCIDLSYSRLGDGLNTLADMIETPLNYPICVLIEAARKVGILTNAKKALKSVVEDYTAMIGSEKQTAFDVYQNLLEIRYTEQFEKLTPDSKLKIEESFYRLLKLDWKTLDYPGATSV